MRTPESELSELASQGLLRSLRVCAADEVPYVRTADGRRAVNFSSNDYLGLSQHPRLKEAAMEATGKFGAGATASRLVCGTFDFHRELEEKIALLKQTDDALVFANGYTTAVGTLTALLGKGDTVILDKLSHASLIDGAKLSGATIRVFPHNNLDRLEAILKSTRESQAPTTRIIVATESVFSMDSDLCPLREIVELKNRHGALLLLDEAHALGVLGPKGLGLAEELGLQGEIDLQMGTLGKAAGGAGGYLAASQACIDLLVNKARSFIYSTAPPPAQIAVAAAALDLIVGDEGHALRERLRDNVNQFRAALSNSAFGFPASNRATPILPLILGKNEAALSASRSLLEAGFLVPAIRYPTVPKGTARLRVTLSAAHGPHQIDAFVRALRKSRQSP